MINCSEKKKERKKCSRRVGLHYHNVITSSIIQSIRITPAAINLKTDDGNAQSKNVSSKEQYVCVLKHKFAKEKKERRLYITPGSN